MLKTNLFKNTEVLDPVAHAKLIADIDKISARAGIQLRFFRESMTKYCTAVEINWVKNFHQNRKEKPGLVLEGVANPDSRCQAIGAALLRNYIDARVMPLGAILDAQKDGEMDNPTVLIIPNMFVTLGNKAIPSWRIQGLYDLLLHRAVHNKPSVLYIENQKIMESTFGKTMNDFISGFERVSE